MKRLQVLAPLLALAWLAAGDALAACNAPVAPSRLPDGASASKTEMLTAMTTLKRYDGDVNAYVKCLEFELKRNRISIVERERLHNAAIERLKEIAEQFNEQVHVFKSLHG
ncbi:MAG: hypothetical protein KF790_08820 [Steroidobacteraceae bacterium]|nr:hypothetical protein [Steroidobacteraceae bacterium]MCW5574162.1 hypothetical protein [Steroidobacteraceae bacterium]